jgi:putative iron-regulated protein
MRINSVLTSSALALLAVACGGDDEGAPTLPANAPVVVSTYADIVHASYQDSLSAAQDMDAALTALVSSPSAATHSAAQDAWRASREPYLQTEVYRFYDGPIDNADDGPEGLLNAWPLDEQHIDYVQGDDDAGIVNDPAMTIDAATLTGMNENGGEKNISTGYHAIEFLLWGQDFNAAGPGARPFTDYVTGAEGTAQNQARRAQYLTTASDLLIGHLEQLVDAWAPDAQNYRAELEAEEPEVALSRIMSGMIILSGFETGGERLQAALDARMQEEEHSCFSDNTHVDMIEDVRGVQNVWLGRYRKLDGSTESGPSIRDLIAAADQPLADEITEQVEHSLEHAEELQEPFDQEILASNPAGNARVEELIEALSDLSDSLERAFEVYGLTRIPDPT